ncbi:MULTISPECIES: PRC-barrel domain-containing protein [Bacillaceae]|uniref:PRC-barrel domain-containing protein n=1 Tax=Evansella alkalicola TaxID=745819 RepID=A0ABS6JXQ8_9BACI|nr:MULTISPECIES: PRC-barrel domain-containing protein [Bacillaceae]MBU9722429.1 PRC-barrel domain-containing protein [Bacillus alkalicola]
MLVFATQLQEFNVQATNGELGKVKDIYFDKENWTARYLVIDTRKWLPGKRVLLSPVTFDHVDFENKTVNILETKENIKDSPVVEEDEPISRRKEAILNTYFAWPHYWNHHDTTNHGAFPTPEELKHAARTEPNLTPEQEESRMLASVNEMKGDLTGFKVKTSDGKLGKVTNFIIDDNNWKLQYFVVDTKPMLHGKFTALSVDWMEEISWEEKEVIIDLPKDLVENGPFFEFNTPFTREDERRLHESYNKTPYF